jgi:DNA-binding ferritin-like protein
MNQRLASAVDLQLQMKRAHWNVKGPSFIGLHELFDKVAETVEGYVDQIAERILQLGGVAEGTVTLWQKVIDERTAPWGIKVISVEVKDVFIPTGLEDAMFMQAQA